MPTSLNIPRSFISSLAQSIGSEVVLRGWVCRLRVLGKTTFIVLKDCSGEAQCVAASDALKDLHLKSDDAIEVHGRVRADDRARIGYEVDVLRCRVLNRSGQNLPFNSASSLDAVGLETLI